MTNREFEQWLDERNKVAISGKYITIRDKEYKYLKKLLDYITNLQEENKKLKELQEKNDKFYDETMKDIKDGLIDRIKRQEQKIERLTELCNKYEEEHKTTFETWQKDIKENELLHSIIKEVREYVKENTEWYDKELGLVEIKGYKSNRIPIVYLYGLLQILDKVGDSNE